MFVVDKASGDIVDEARGLTLCHKDRKPGFYETFVLKNGTSQVGIATEFLLHNDNHITRYVLGEVSPLPPFSPEETRELVREALEVNGFYASGREDFRTDVVFGKNMIA